MIEDVSLMTMKNVLGVSMSTIAGEHFFSAGLSSPWSVAKFAESKEDQDQVWNYFDESAKSSMIFGALLSWSLKSLWPITGSTVVVAYYKSLYKDALNKASSNGLKKTINQTGLSDAISQITSTGSIQDIQMLLRYI